MTLDKHARTEGFKARKNGIGRDKNPYTAWNEQGKRTQWAIGWREADVAYVEQSFRRSIGSTS